MSDPSSGSKVWLRRAVLVLLIFNGLLLPCGLIPVLAPLNAHNPIQIAFITTISITNATDDDLWVTPIGAVGPQGRRVPLPIFTQQSPAYVSRARGDFPVAPGNTIDILYDWDDVNLAEIVVANAAGGLRQIVADPHPEINQYRQPQPNTFTIADFDALDPVPPNTLAAYHDAQQPFSLVGRLLPFAAPWLTFIPLLLTYLRLRRSTPAPVGEIE
ncbi:MAG: hypothetical protein AAF823_10645 [Planctomycetota bacterium]